jgi:DNA-directed RNA polymerase subunit RPC12/RpoP
MNETQIQCPKCKSTQVSANRKGWTMSTGLIGSSKILITCLKCGKQFKPGEDLEGAKRKQQQQAQAMQSPVFWVILIVFMFLFLWMFKGCFV